MKHWRGLEEFIAVVETGSISRAAETLGIATSQVSKRINELEARLDTRLLHRSTRLVTSTTQGKRYYDTCKQALLDIRTTEEAIGAEHESLSGHLKICCVGITQHTMLVNLFSAFLQENPRIKLELPLVNELPNLVEQSIDFAIVSGDVDSQKYNAVRLTWVDHVLVASPGLLASHDEPKKPQDLENLPCIIQNSSTWHLFNGDEAASVDVTGRWKSNSVHACIEAAACDLGVFAIPAYALHTYAANGRLQCILPTWRMKKPLYVVHPYHTNISAKATRLVDFLNKAIAETDANANTRAIPPLQQFINADQPRKRLLNEVAAALNAEKLAGQLDSH